MEENGTRVAKRAVFATLCGQSAWCKRYASVEDTLRLSAFCVMHNTGRRDCVVENRPRIEIGRLARAG
jgi:hypothetical protein